MDKSIPALLGISEDNAEAIYGMVASELKSAIQGFDTPAEIKAALIKSVTAKMQGGEDTPSGTTLAFVGMVVEQAYNAAVIAAKKPHSFGPLFKNAKK